MYWMRGIVIGFILLVPPLLFSQEEEADPLDVQLGEKLFLEDRFSQGFFSQFGGDYNKPLLSGDPILAEFEILKELIPSPFANQQVSCASCHMVDQMNALQDNFVLTYNDLSVRSRIPWRSDGLTHTTRNSMNMVLSSFKEGSPLHWDGEFYSSASLTCATLVGRNMGWLSGEEELARNHVVNIIKNDSGLYRGQVETQESYSDLFGELNIKIADLSDEEILNSVCKTIEVYLVSLDFSRDKDGGYNGSAYDRFLILNGLRTVPNEGETHREYLTYLKDQINFKTDWKWTTELPMQYHDHQSKFGPQEFHGMKVFYGKAQCASCHRPPEFTDSRFHNTGISQFEYDRVHGKNAFSKIKIPEWSERVQNPSFSFTASEEHPAWKGTFKQNVTIDTPMAMDLGIWNVLGHPDKSEIQDQVRKMLCESYQLQDCQWSDQQYLKNAVGLFKTPTLRSLGQSPPYLHNGSADSLLGVLALYLRGAHFSKKGQIRNADPFLKTMQIDTSDFRALELFLKSLDEDYE